MGSQRFGHDLATKTTKNFYKKARWDFFIG